MSAAELMELLRCDVSDNDTTQSGEVSGVTSRWTPCWDDRVVFGELGGV